MSFATTTAHTPLWILIPQIFLFGCAISLEFSAMNALSYADIPEQQISHATSITSIVLQLAGCFSIALTGLAINYLVGFHGLQPFEIHPLHQAFILLGLLTLPSALLFRSLRPEDGESVKTQKIS